ncbi:MAG: hypothetical protein Q4B48_05115 [Syntrophomonadaceae bacterium]|nr:hypothetical protein [Syntrophomonadaceae bacterium]
MTNIALTFYNQGLRSYIEVDLCARCPRQDDKGCCGFYSPVFYYSDLAWLLLHDKELVREIFALERLTVLDASVTLNQLIDGASYRCRFHRLEGGCRLPQHLRESVCRHFVCSGIGWQREPELADWAVFFDRLADYEIAVNARMAARIEARGLSLREPLQREAIFALLPDIYAEETAAEPDFFRMVPAVRRHTLARELTFAETWKL